MRKKKILQFLIDILPEIMKNLCKKRYFLSQIKNGTFKSAEIEWSLLEKWIQPGDVCIDIGANIGRYTLKLSKIVGPQGLIIAIEPLTKSFEILAYFITKLKITNVSLLNVAASSECHLMSVIEDKGRAFRDYLFETNTRTHTTNLNHSGDEIKLGVKIDDFNFPFRVKLVKIDVEGNEFSVVQGMLKIIKKDYPVLIIENNDNALHTVIENLGYKIEFIATGSRNKVYLKK